LGLGRFFGLCLSGGGDGRLADLRLAPQSHVMKSHVLMLVRVALAIRRCQARVRELRHAKATRDVAAKGIVVY
jgi:hypothetical protein